jgi:hypothetical protein
LIIARDKESISSNHRGDMYHLKTDGTIDPYTQELVEREWADIFDHIMVR